MLRLLALLAVLPLLMTAEEPYRKVIHNTNPDARCLDGSPALIYIHEGGEASKFLIYFLGGGACGAETLSGTLQSCYQRSKTLLGSSTLWPDTVEGQGYLSTDPALNQFSNWTKVVFAYCDGSLHQGNNQGPIDYKNTLLYFRGGVITRSHFQYLTTKFNLASATKILLTGGSAGGIATFLWTNYLRSIVKDPLVVYSVPDSGVFLNYPSSVTRTNKTSIQLQNLFKLANVDQKTPLTTCNKARPDREYQCLFLEYAWTSVQGKLLLINSEYDSYAITNVIDIPCLKEGSSGFSLIGCSAQQKSIIEGYRKQYKVFLGNFQQFVKNSVWTISCSNHVYALYNKFYNANAQRVPMTNGLTIKNAVEKFVLQDQRISSIDSIDWPQNAPCAY